MFLCLMADGALGADTDNESRENKVTQVLIEQDFFILLPFLSVSWYHHSFKPAPDDVCVNGWCKWTDIELFGGCDFH